MLLRSGAKRFHINRYGRSIDIYLVIALIVLATLARFILIQNNWPVTNSDEGNMALLARHVAYNGEWPIFFYGLPYMGPIEGYIAAPLFHIFGPSTFALRLGLLPFFSLFLICMYFLTRLLYTRWLALFTVLVLCFGSDEVLMRQLKAVGEYPELLFFASFISLMVVWLALSNGENERHRQWRRYLLYGVLGLVTGVALWVDFLILPFIGTGALLLWMFCRRELRSWKLLALLAGLVVGAFPLIYYNLTAPIAQNSLVVLISNDRSGSNLHLPFLQQLSGTFFIALPDVLSFNPLCQPSAFPYFGNVNGACVMLHGAWSAGYLLLLAMATYGAWSLIQRGWKGQSLFHPDWTYEQRQEIALQCGRLMLLVSAIGTIMLYALSPAPAAYPAPTSRYINCILIAFPSVLWPLWNGIGTGWNMPNWRRMLLVGRMGLLLLVLFMFVAGTFSTFGEIPAAQAFYRNQELLVQKLEALGATRIYSEYWTCNRLTFQSQEKIICSALSTNLGPGFDRYPPYRKIVHATPHPAYVFPLSTPQVTLLDQKLANDASFREMYQRRVYEGYVLYVPR
jgi:hypothetical protein